MKNLTWRGFGEYTISLIVMGVWVYEATCLRVTNDQLTNAAVMVVIGYWLGSSKGSQNKDATNASQAETIARLSTPAPSPTVPSPETPP